MSQPSHYTARDPEILGGMLVLVGARVPVQTLLNYPKSGQSLDEFLIDFPTVPREQAMGGLSEAEEALLSRAHSA
ncbi:MAG TPA: DUF433 domain-containing protein [Chloroflexota bacterium]|nr:DUF433 domain-containing protein [Chloroflexota bacterium]